MEQNQYVITSQQLAERLQTNPASIRAYRAGLRCPPLLSGLPAPIQNQPRLLWLTRDIEAWIESRRTFSPSAAPTAPTAPARKIGRPTKEEQAEARRLGLAVSELRRRQEAAAREMREMSRGVGK